MTETTDDSSHTDPATAVRQTVHYSGRVQGVGFRFSVARTATCFEVTGHVKNLPDGRVRLIAEGDPAVVEAFITAVAAHAPGHIEGQQRELGAATGEFSRFAIMRRP